MQSEEILTRKTKNRKQKKSEKWKVIFEKYLLFNYAILVFKKSCLE
jgi:hypothetical protein